MLTGRDSATAEEGADWLQELGQDLHIRSLTELGLKQKDLDLAVEKSINASSMKGNPVVLEQNGSRRENENPRQDYCRAYSLDGRFLAVLRHVPDKGIWKPKKVII